jgi:hypothetical protein
MISRAGNSAVPRLGLCPFGAELSAALVHGGDGVV